MFRYMCSNNSVTGYYSTSNCIKSGFYLGEIRYDEIFNLSDKYE